MPITSEPEKSRQALRGLKVDNLLIIPQNGWYELRQKGTTEENPFMIGICFLSTMGSWGYWDYNDETRKKEWVVIDVPEKDPKLVRRAIPYTKEEQVWADEVIASVKEQFAVLRTIFG